MALQPNPAAQENRHLLDYIRVLLKRLWLIVGIFVVVVGVVGYATWRAVPQYRATAIINIHQPNMLGQLDPSNLVHSVNQSQVYMNTQYKMLMQRKTIERMVEDHELVDWKDSENERWFEGMVESQIVKSIAGNIQVEPERDTTLVHVTVVDTRRELVHRIVNALVDTFVALQAEKAETSINTTLDMLSDDLLHYQEKADQENLKISTLLAEHNTDRETLLNHVEWLRDRARVQQESVDREGLALDQNRPAYERIRPILDENEGDEIANLEDSLFEDDAKFQELEKDLVVKERELRSLESEFGQSSDRIQNVRSEIATLTALMSRRKLQLLESFCRKFEEDQERLNLMQDRLENVEEDFRELSTVKREYDDYSSIIERHQREADRYASLWDKLQVSRRDNWKPVSVAQEARQPFAPFKPDKQLNMILAIIVGLIAGVGISFFLEYMDDTVKTKEELQRITDVPLFGVIPNITARKSDVAKKDLYAYTQPKSTISEAFRGIRTALSYSSQKKENHIYLVTSAGPKEGKTTIAINVATVMAYSGTRTLLVDADLRKPRLHKSFEVKNTRGLTNLIIQDATIEDVVLPSSIENLDLLPSGPIPPNPSELLGRDRMTELLDELRTHYDRILLDTPPIGAVTDAAVLGRIVDSVILVVHAGRTRKKLIERGLEQLSQIDVDVSGIVLNNLKIGRKRYYPGYYHYYYYYSSYYGADDKRSLKAQEKSKKQRS